MGFTSFWATITAPRVKEITPQNETKWLDRGRPSTAAGGRSGIRRPDSTGHGPDFRPTTSNGEKQAKRRGRSLSRPRRWRQSDLNIERRASPIDGSEDVPVVPTIPTSLAQAAVQPHHVNPSEETSSRPGTGLTSESLEATHDLELPARPVLADSSASSQTTLTQYRSKSPASPTQSTKMRHLLRMGGSRDKSLPPPPPPTKALPVVPTSPVFSVRPTSSSKKSLRHYHSVSALSGATSRTSHSSARPHSSRCDSPNESLLRSFPSVPTLVYDPERTPDSSFRSSEASSVSSPTRERAASRDDTIPLPTNVVYVRGHEYKDSALGTPKTPFTPSSFQPWSHGKGDEDNEEYDEGVDVTGWTDEDLRAWDSVAQLEEPASRCGMYHGADVRRQEMDRPDEVPMGNDQALAALHFGELT